MPLWCPADFGFARPGQAGLQHQGLLTTGEATGLCGQGIVVLPNDVHLLALLLGRAAAQSIEPGAVIPIGATRTAGHAGCGSRAVARTPRRCCGGIGAVRGFTGAAWCLGATARARGWTPRTIASGWSAAGLLQLHELAGRHRLAHAARTTGTAGAATLPALGRIGFAPDRLADQLE